MNVSWKVTRGRRALYWSLQVLGWGAYLGWFELSLRAVQYPQVKYVQLPVIALTHMAGSHALRAVIKGRHWIGLPVRKLLPRLLAAMVAIDVPVQALCLVTALAANVANVAEYASGALFYLVAAVILYSAWSALYFGFQYAFLYRDSEVQRIRLEASLREAELAALKSQVNPHFLFNCLNNVRSLITEDSDRARDMLLRLSELLRYALDAVRRERLPLGEELDVVKAYLELQQLQYEDRLQWKVEASQQARDSAIPPMLVQQLVENAMKHGIAKLANGGSVRVSASVNSGRLQVAVESSGQLGGGTGGIGLANARERLRLFAPAATLALMQATPNLVRATVEIPL